MITKEEVEAIRAQLPEEWRHLLRFSESGIYSDDFITDGRLDLNKILGVIEQRKWFMHIGF